MSIVDYRENARVIRQRLRNPPNGRKSSELDIVTEPELRKLRIAACMAASVETAGGIEAKRQRQLDEMIARAVERSKQDTEAAAERKRKEAERGYPPMERIIAEVARWYGVTKIDITSQRRDAQVVRPRHVVMYLGRHHTPLSLPQIGMKIGQRDHTTILSGVRKIQGLLDDGDEKLVANIASLRKVLGIEMEPT